MTHSLRRVLPAALLLLALLALQPAGAVAQTAPAPAATTAAIASGETFLRLDQRTARSLARNRVQLGLRGTTRFERGAVRFPVSGGRIDPQTLAGTVAHTGVLVFRRNGRSVALRDPRVRVGSPSVLTARVGGARVTILRLDLRRARLGRPDPMTRTARGVRVQLAAPAARALNRAFRTPRLFRAGLRIGTVRTSITLAEAVLAGGETSLALDPSTAQALTGLGIAAGPAGAARTDGGGLAFPVTGGLLGVPSLAGTIAHGGGLALTRDATRVELTDFEVVLDDTPALSALVGGQRVEVLGLGLAGLQRGAEGTTVLAGGIDARLTAAAAGALNQAFSTTAFEEGLRLGTLTVRAQAR